MGYKNREEAETETENSSSESLLFAIMCIIGLPVDVHIRDGSIISGTFYTTSVDKDYGIILKNAKVIKKGKCNANVADGNVIETLVICSNDFVQIIAKGVLLPANAAAGNIAGDNVEAAVTNATAAEIAVSEAKVSNKSATDKEKINKNRQIEEDWLQGEVDQNKQKIKFKKENSADEVQSSSLIVGSCLNNAKPIEEEQVVKKPFPNGVSCDYAFSLLKPENQCSEMLSSAGNSSPDAVSSSVSTASSPLGVASESRCNLGATSTDAVSRKSLESNRSSKEFKLNPGAKIFSPSFANHMSATPPALPTVAGMAYVPNSSAIAPVAGPQLEGEISHFAPWSSVPAKFAPYNNLTAGSGGTCSQLSQPIIGHMGSRMHPIRYAGQYHAVQAGSQYAHPSSQAVVVGRVGQLVYMQPVPHDLVQSPAAILPVPARPVLAPHQVQYPKHQGNAAGQALQLCVPSPLVAAGQQPFPMSSPVPLPQPPFPANRPIPVPGSNALFSTKFP